MSTITNPRPPICVFQTTRLNATLPRTMKDATAFLLGGTFGRFILVYHPKCCVLYNYGTDTISEPISFRFGVSVTRHTHTIAVYQSRVLCAITKGRDVHLKDINLSLSDPGLLPTTTLQLNTPRVEGAAIAETDYGIAICSGMLNSGALTSNMEVIVITNDGAQANHLSDVPYPRSHAAAVSIHGGPLYFIGGRDRDGQSGRTDIFHHQQRRWSVGPTLNISRWKFSAVVIQNRWIVVFGGCKFRGFELMDTQSPRPAWIILDVPEAISAMETRSGVVVGNDLYMFGGGSERISKFTFTITVPPPPPPPPPPATTTIAAATATSTALLSTPPLPAKAQLSNPSPSETSIPLDISHVEINPDCIPEPPPRPFIPQSFSVRDRIQALEKWVKDMECLQTTYCGRIEESSKQVKLAFDTARDLKLKQIEQRSVQWFDDTHRLIQQAQDEVETCKTRLQEGSLLPFLARTNLDDYADDVPSQLRCPISLNLMVDPVVASDGITYERASLQAWFQNESTSPLTGAKLESKAIISNLVVKGLCSEFAQHRKAKPTDEFQQLQL